VRPGCGACLRDSHSPSGGTQTCWTCTGHIYTRECSPPPPCGGDHQSCCDPTDRFPVCDDNAPCVDGICTPCGGNGDVCCTGGAACNSGLDCINGHCSICGGYQEACCRNLSPSCSAPYTCDTSLGSGVCI
jgi:hypothetical protein